MLAPQRTDWLKQKQTYADDKNMSAGRGLDERKGKKIYTIRFSPAVRGVDGFRGGRKKQIDIKHCFMLDPEMLT